MATIPPNPNLDDTGQREVRVGQVVICAGPTVGRVLAVMDGACIVRPLWADHLDVKQFRGCAGGYNCGDVTVADEPEHPMRLPGEADWIVRLACDLANVTATAERVTHTWSDPPWSLEAGAEIDKCLRRALELLWEAAGDEVWLKTDSAEPAKGVRP